MPYSVIFCPEAFTFCLTVELVIWSYVCLCAHLLMSLSLARLQTPCGQGFHVPGLTVSPGHLGGDQHTLTSSVNTPLCLRELQFERQGIMSQINVASGFSTIRTSAVYPSGVTKNPFDTGCKEDWFSQLLLNHSSPASWLAPHKQLKEKPERAML